MMCFKSPARNPDLAIAVGQSSYLALMPRGKLVDGHCCIVTQEHAPSMRQVGVGVREGVGARRGEDGRCATSGAMLGGVCPQSGFCC